MDRTSRYGNSLILAWGCDNASATQPRGCGRLQHCRSQRCRHEDWGFSRPRRVLWRRVLWWACPPVFPRARPRSGRGLRVRCADLILVRGQRYVVLCRGLCPRSCGPRSRTHIGTRLRSYEPRRELSCGIAYASEGSEWRNRLSGVTHAAAGEDLRRHRSVGWTRPKQSCPGGQTQRPVGAPVARVRLGPTLGTPPMLSTLFVLYPTRGRLQQRST